MKDEKRKTQRNEKKNSIGNYMFSKFSFAPRSERHRFEKVTGSITWNIYQNINSMREPSIFHSIHEDDDSLYNFYGLLV